MTSSSLARIVEIVAVVHPDILLGPIQPELIRNEVLADLLEDTARRSPDQIALIFADRCVTYKELNQAADRAASALIDAGVKPGQIVGLWLPRGIDLLIMQAAIAKAGAAWLPLDADTPVERIAVCLEDASAPGIVTCALFSSRLENLGRHLWTIENLLTPLETPLQSRTGLLSTHPAYVIYTSGSTGKPKGIEITQGGICHFLRSENAVLGVRGSDRVYQGFSVAFDMSFEEIWISYLVGATLWIAPKELASDPEALPLALAANGVTVLHAVPTLLALFNQDIPSLRLINLGGEMCPEALVNRWAKPGLQIFNTYGPTEATVSASLAALRANEPVTIGSPLPNYGMLIIHPATENGLTLMPRGDTGELCITGPGVAAGYLGRPDLTAEKFLVNPWSSGAHDGRLYRTGDLARIDTDGRVQCLGRTDDQVKIRGFRVELGEIEEVLARQPGVGTVAVILRNDDGIDQLIAFIVPENGATIATGTLRAALGKLLPPYMVPGFFELMSEMPRLTSGKIDRKALKIRPLTVSPVGTASVGSDTAETVAEEALFAALIKLFPGQPIRRDADFFSDLGGHSLFAARLASALRTDPRFAHVTVRDIYMNRVIGRIAAALSEVPEIPVAVDTTWIAPSSLKRWVCGAAQAAAVPWLVAMRMMQWLAPFFTYHFFTGDPGDSIPRAIVMSVGVFLLATFFEFGIAIAAKWLILGRLKPGRYPLWGLTYYRWWLTDRLIEAAPTYLLSGSSIYTWWLRALGARIGSEVLIGSIMLRVHDLLIIEDGATIGNAVNFENARVEHGELRIGQIAIGREANVGSYVVMEGNTTIGEFGHLEGQSALSDGQSVPANRIWGGSPARDMGAFDKRSNSPRPPVTRKRQVGESIFFLLGALLITTLFFMPVFPSFILIDWLDNYDRFPWLQSNQLSFQLTKYFVMAFPATAVLIICTALLSAGIRWSILPRLKAGSWPVRSNKYCSKWLVNQIQESSLSVLHGVYATIYAPFWYRLLGAKVGRGAEISTALGVVPDMLTLGEETFIADAVLLGDEQIDGGWMRMQPTVISRRSFVGNGAYIPDGTTLPENVLIGVHSRAPANDKMHNGDVWLGSPPINLPAREQVSGFPEHLTFRPSKRRRLGRGLVEAFRIVSPHAIVIAVGYTLVLNLMPLAGAGLWGEVIWLLTLSGLMYGVGTFIWIVCIKWLLLKRYHKCSVPMWTPFVWLSEGVTNLYEGIAVPNLLNYLRGTPWLPLAFNLLGCKIGRGVYLNTTDITEFDCVTIGDYSELNALACPQTHLFEDRVMKIDHVTIGNRVYMGPRSAVLYSAVVGDNAKLGALTLVMKGEQIPAGTSWRGCPAAPELKGSK
ncbi:amino acid adenylation domain-containing protein [Glaciimonas sp. Gout2]|uniref:Pls/PosA family non-ribosomal peptide synthetase n=2 Tax=Glaciimonas TaxID=1229970 RepID=UPI002AB5A361|nr:MULTISPECIES: Pls/PosA family non-ribosomal peptide synthetase [unclassified Glaciimonas]MDY7548663.1 amino acid adenylation domain-containing protein [Glaciimonas sp. CA11.2]MEB0014345.1 amino acid adenylation domain-containing protein [Glaciimonas sp. Cout2]MEB0083762.1 amino acid adenylation domain-containing protein [Glaciimonas sp. Gout2]